MNVILLCAGYGTRLYPLTENTPKPLLPVKDKPILEHILKKVYELEKITSIHLVSNDKFFYHFLEWAKHQDKEHPLKIHNDRTTSNEDRLGALGDIQFVMDKLDHDEDLLIIAGDNLFRFDLKDMQHVLNEKRKTIIALFDVEDKNLAKHYGVVAINEDKKLIDFTEKPEEPKSSLISTGIYMIPQEDIGLLKEYIGEGHSKDKIGSFFEWLHKKEDVFCHVTSGQWFDIGTIDQLERANEEFSHE